MVFSGKTSDCNLVTLPTEDNLYNPSVFLLLLFTVGSSATKNPKSVVFVETSPENDAKGDKSKVEVKRELKILFVIFFI